MTAIGEVAIFTADVASATAFYGRLLESSPEAEWPGGALFSAGGAKLLVHDSTLALPGGPPNEDHVAFTVPDVDAACAELAAAGLELLLAPLNYDWGRSGYLRDPDGRLVELTQI